MSEPAGEALDERIGHRFADPALLECALTHRSFSHESADENCRHNESLEFLGDAVLAFVLADRLFRELPDLDEGGLSKHKSLLERSSTLAIGARRLGIHRHLRLGRGEQRNGGTRNERILAGAFEALVAAVYLDGGLEPVRRLVERALAKELSDADSKEPVTDYKSALQEFTQGEGLGAPEYRVVEESGADHRKLFRVAVRVGESDLADGRGTTKRSAQQVAARRALAHLRGSVGDDDE